MTLLPERLASASQVGARAWDVAQALFDRASRDGAWREAYQSSPAAYLEIPPDLARAAAERRGVPLKAVERLYAKTVAAGTFRFQARVALGGSQIRIRLGHEGLSPLVVAAASVAGAAPGGQGRPQALTFGGTRSVTIAPNGPVVSDPIAMAVEPGGRLWVSVHLAQPCVFQERGGARIEFAPGDQTLALTLASAKIIVGRPLLTAVEVWSSRPPRLVVAFGDSITDGDQQSLDALRGWPERLNQRLARRASGPRHAVVNAGLRGNKLLSAGAGEAGLSRLDRDALRLEGVSHIVLLEGTNDIGFSGEPPLGSVEPLRCADLVAGYRQVIARAQARGVKVVIGAIPPFAGSPIHYTAERELLRQKVNHWIRHSGEPQGVIDFDEALRDPQAPERLLRVYDSGDGLHPSQMGLRAMGDAVDLSLFG